MSHRRLLAFSLWLVAVLYCWCGAFYKFSFLRAEDDSPLSFWIRVGAVLYCILFTARIMVIPCGQAVCRGVSRIADPAICRRPRRRAGRCAVHGLYHSDPVRVSCILPALRHNAAVRSRVDRRVHLRILRAAHAPVRSPPAPAEKLTHTATFAATAVSAWILSAIRVSIMACPAGLGWMPSAQSSCGYRWDERNAERTSIIGHP